MTTVIDAFTTKAPPWVMRMLTLVLLLAAPAQAAECDAEQCSWTLGQCLLRAGEYDAALQWFEQGFTYTHDAKFLFEIAESHRLARHWAEAIAAYQRFLRHAPQAANRVETEASLADCQRRIDELAALQPPDPAGEPRHRRANRLVAGGAPVLVLGILTSLAASGLALMDLHNPTTRNIGLGIAGGGLLLTGIGGTLVGFGVAADRR